MSDQLWQPQPDAVLAALTLKDGSAGVSASVQPAFTQSGCRPTWPRVCRAAKSSAWRRGRSRNRLCASE